jgi:hypothetical protein
MATEHGSRSETHRLRDVYIDVEKALQSGVSRKAILEALHQDGFTMSLKMFDKALYRIRKSKQHKDKLYETRQDVSITPSLEKTVHVIPTKKESVDTSHPFFRAQTPPNGERHRDYFVHNSVPDQKSIYGEE